MSEATDRIKTLIDGFDARIDATPASAWDNQSPCAEWADLQTEFLGFTGRRA